MFLELLLFIFIIKTGICCDCRPDAFKCNPKDGVCLKDNINAYYPAGLNASSMIPLFPLCIDSVEVKSHDRAYTLQDVTVTGLENCEFDHVRSSRDKLHFQMTFICQALQFDGNYTYNGYYLYRPMKGLGRFKIVTDHSTIKLNNFHVATFIDNLVFYRINDFHVTIESMNMTSNNFENLINLNQQRARDRGLPVGLNEKLIDNSCLWYPIMSRIIWNYNVILSTLPTPDEYAYPVKDVL